MPFIGSGSGQVTYQRNDDPATTTDFTINVSEGDSSLIINFVPNIGYIGEPPVVELSLDGGYDPSVQVVDMEIVEAYPYIFAVFGLAPYGAEYDSGGACIGHVHIAWTSTSSGRTYTGLFHAYDMASMSGGSPISLKFVKFTFETTGSSN